MNEIALFYPLSRKTLDLFKVIRHRSPDVKVSFISSSLVETLFTFLVYGYRARKTPKEGSIILPQEVELIIENDNLSLISDRRLVLLLNNKREFSDLCKEKNILHPLNRRQGEIIQVQTNLIFKPIIGSGSRGINIVKDFVGAVNIPDGYICQDYLGDSNEIFGFFAFCNNGRVESSYNHKRIETYPKVGGVSVLSEVNYDESLRLAGVNVVEKLGYSGLIMIEFKYFNNQWYVIEINPRLWGSLLMTLIVSDDPISKYLSFLGLDAPKGRISKSEKLIWLFPYGIFRYKVLKNVLKSILVNYPRRGGLLLYIWRTAMVILYKILS